MVDPQKVKRTEFKVRTKVCFSANYYRFFYDRRNKEFFYNRIITENSKISFGFFLHVITLKKAILKNRLFGPQK